MDFAQIEKFLRDHWPAGLIVAFICIPAVWAIATIVYSQQIRFLESRLETLEIQVEDLKQYKERLELIEKQKREKKFTGGLVGYSTESLADALFSPSNPD